MVDLTKQNMKDEVFFLTGRLGKCNYFLVSSELGSEFIYMHCARGVLFPM